MILVAVIGFGICANADDSKSCKVTGTDGIVVASINTYDCEKETVIVDRSNAVNITMTVQFSAKSKTVTFLAKPNIEGQKTVTGFDDVKGTAYTASITSLTGSKCKQVL